MAGPAGPRSLNRYAQLIERVFFQHYEEGQLEVAFEREDLTRAASELGVTLPKNLGDIVYSFRYRGNLPDSVRGKAPVGQDWIIEPAGRGRYRFVSTSQALIVPSTSLAETKVPDATPGVIARYALGDEQALLAKVRYNRLIDIFTGIACYSLQSHLRTSVPQVGQVETDEIYVGVDKRGVHFVIPVQAKGGRDTISVVQIAQDIAMSRSKFPDLICRPIAAQFMADNLIALFEFEESDSGVVIGSERHYRLVPFDQISPADLVSYRLRAL